ncbi:hypothetical protein [Savagea serpentis]|nr:hypothetical protein [Savagea serpentis]
MNNKSPKRGRMTLLICSILILLVMLWIISTSTFFTPSKLGPIQ